MRSLGAMMRDTVGRHGDRTAYKVPVKGGFDSWTYRELWQTVRRYAGAIRSLGLARGDRLGILSENCVEWALVDWACQCLGVILVPIYPTLPADQVEYILRDAGAEIVLVGDKSQAAKTEGLAGIRTLLLKGDFAERVESHGGEITDAELDAAIDAIGPEDLSTIIYTSGTTGAPKGVMLPHRATLHVLQAAKKDLPVFETDVFLSFLPMSHVYERVAGQALPVFLGATLAFSKNLASLANDMVVVQPTIMLCVPRFLDSVRDRVLDKVEKDPPLRRRIFHLALSQGTAKARGKFAPLAGILDPLVGSKVRARLGGRMRFLISGGAALAPSLAEFYMAMGVTVLQGYGLTETAAGTCISHPDDNQYWTAGRPLDLDVKIAEDGEILVKGPSVMLGYYHLPEETAKAIDADGYFHTGDIGVFEGKNLRITDRKKDILVLGNGKNVAPQPIENALKASPYISEAVLFGDGLEACVALIVPNADHVRAHLKIHDAEPLSKHPEARTLIKAEVDRTNKTLASFETVKKFVLLDNPFSIETGELTPSLKVRRKVVKEKYAEAIDSMTRGGTSN